MPEPLTVDNGSLTDYDVLVDVVTDGTLGTGHKQLFGLVDATVGGTNKASVSAAGALKVDASSVAVPVTDNAGSLTVDSAQLPAALVGGRLDVVVGAALPAGTNNIGDVDVLSLPALPAGANSIGTVDTELTTADLDTGVGADTRAVVGLVGAASGGGALIEGTAANGLEVDVTRVSGTVTVGDGGSTLSVDDGAGSLTVDVGTALPAGTNNIGDVDVLTQPARSATVDAITAKLATDAIQNGLTALTPKFAIIDAATLGDNTLVASVAGKKIRVLALYAVASGGENTLRFESGVAGTALSGQMQVSDNGGFVLPFNPVGWFETAATTLLNLELAAATSVDGGLVYVEV